MTVYAVQCPLSRDEKGQTIDRYDLLPAKEFGEVVRLLSPDARPFNPKPIIKELYEKLETFSDEDYLICIGNPILLSMAFSIACDINDGKVTLLQWHGYRQTYIPVVVDMGFTYTDT